MNNHGKGWFLAVVGGLVMTGQLLCADGAAAAYPERPVTLLVGFSPGGSADLSARALAEAAKKTLGVPVVIENKPGGTGAVALAALLAHHHDGYTLCATPSSVLIRVSQMQKVPFRPLSDFKPLVGYCAPQLGILVRSDAPWKSLRALMDDARRHPGRLKYATTGPGSTTHAAVEEIAGREKAQLIHVPYKGGSEALLSLLGGHVDFASLTSEFVPSVKAGQTRLLALASDRRLTGFPDIPTFKEAGYDFVNDAVFAIVGPRNLPAAVAEKLERAFAAATVNKAYLDTLARIDLLPVLYSGRQFEDFLKVNWGRINRHLIATGLIREAATPPE